MRPIFTILVADAFFHFVLMRQKERGVGVNNQKWGIEMNNARQLYLMTYRVIDMIDVLIKKCDMYYRSWKYWHSAKNHFLALAVVVAYDMYKECKSEAFEEFDLTEEQAKRSLLNFHEFREKLSTQGLKYHPKDQRYPGDSRMRPNTQLNKKHLVTQLAKRNAKRREARAANGRVVTPQIFREAKKTNQSTKRRLCGNLGSLTDHIESIARVKSGNLCAWCGQTCYTKCSICDLGCHNDDSKGKNKGKQCFIHLHDDACYGLGWKDRYELFGGDKVAVRNEWTPPSPEEFKAHAAHIARISNPQTRYTLRSGAGLVTTDDEVVEEEE